MPDLVEDLRRYGDALELSMTGVEVSELPPGSDRSRGRTRVMIAAAALVAVAVLIAVVALGRETSPSDLPARRPASTTTTGGTINGKTFGTMPDLPASATMEERYAAAPDFLAVSSRDGNSIAGYAKKTDMFPEIAPGRHAGMSGELTVYGDDLETIVGRFIPGKGFVSLSEDPDSVPDINPSPTQLTAPTE